MRSILFSPIYCWLIAQIDTGPTSLSFILHSTPSIPVRAFENYDARYHQTWEVGKSGDGFIQVSDHSPPIGTASLTKNPLEYNRLDREVLASLINSYFNEIAPQFPIVSEAEFLSTSSPPPVLLYAICSVAAARRGVPKEVFDSLRMAVNQIIKAEDVLSTASVVNVQALLILGMSGDVHSTSIQTAMTAAWLRLGAVGDRPVMWGFDTILTHFTRLLPLCVGDSDGKGHNQKEGLSLTADSLRRRKTWVSTVRKQSRRTLSYVEDSGEPALLRIDGASRIPNLLLVHG